MSDEAIIHVVGAAILEGGRCLVARRGPGMALPGYWEFPGGKVAAGESPEVALVREIREEMGIGIEVGAWLGRGEALVGDRRIVLDVYLATRLDGKPRLSEHSEMRWIGADEVEGLDWAEADRPVLVGLQRILGRGPIEDDAPAEGPLRIESY